MKEQKEQLELPLLRIDHFPIPDHLFRDKAKMDLLPRKENAKRHDFFGMMEAIIEPGVEIPLGLFLLNNGMFTPCKCPEKTGNLIARVLDGIQGIVPGMRQIMMVECPFINKGSAYKGKCSKRRGKGECVINNMKQTIDERVPVVLLVRHPETPYL